MDVQIPPAAIHQGASWEYGGRGHATQMHTFAGLELPLTPHDLLMLLSKAPPLLVYEQARVSPDAVALLDGDALRGSVSRLAPPQTPAAFCATLTGRTTHQALANRLRRVGRVYFLSRKSEVSTARTATFPSGLQRPRRSSPLTLGNELLLYLQALLAAAKFRYIPVTFLSDCQAALGIISGRCNFAPGGCPQALRHVFELRRQLASLPNCPDSFEYVPGHKGHFANELADKLSKHGPYRDPPQTLQSCANGCLKVRLGCPGQQQP